MSIDEAARAFRSACEAYDQAEVEADRAGEASKAAYQRLRDAHVAMEDARNVLLAAVYPEGYTA